MGEASWCGVEIPLEDELSLMLAAIDELSNSEVDELLDEMIVGISELIGDVFHEDRAGSGTDPDPDGDGPDSDEAYGSSSTPSFEINWNVPGGECSEALVDPDPIPEESFEQLTVEYRVPDADLRIIALREAVESFEAQSASKLSGFATVEIVTRAETFYGFLRGD